MLYGAVIALVLMGQLVVELGPKDGQGLQEGGVGGLVGVWCLPQWDVPAPTPQPVLSPS